MEKNSRRIHTQTKKYGELSKEQLAKAIQKRRECNTRAQKIVESLLQPTDSVILLSCLKDINQCHYQDIVEERAIIKLCGYPICGEELKNIPKKHYHISTFSNKVYDIGERKHFCSNICFKASQYLKQQMLTSPLWLRDQENIPNFKLLSIEKECKPQT